MFSSHSFFNPRQLAYVLSSLEAALSEVINIFVLEVNGWFHFFPYMSVQRLLKLLASALSAVTAMKFTFF